MNGGEIFVLAILLIIFGFAFLKHKAKLEHGKPPEDPEARSRIEVLERRVQTLERIVTEKDYDLKREFDKL